VAPRSVRKNVPPPTAAKVVAPATSASVVPQKSSLAVDTSEIEALFRARALRAASEPPLVVEPETPPFYSSDAVKMAPPTTPRSKPTPVPRSRRSLERADRNAKLGAVVSPPPPPPIPDY
jgi:hypothetical protein